MLYPISFFNPFNLVCNQNLQDYFEFEIEPHVEETEDDFAMSFELPGFEKGNISILREHNILSISANRESKTKHGLDKRSFTRRYALPQNVDLEHVDAEYKDGILTIAAKKKEKFKPRRIEVR